MTLAMTDAQAKLLRRLCKKYSIEFDPSWTRDEASRRLSKLVAREKAEDNYVVGNVVFVECAGRHPQLAELVEEDPHHPHLVKVIYLESRTGARIARKRIVRLVEDKGPIGG